MLFVTPVKSIAPEGSSYEELTMGGAGFDHRYRVTASS
jgi:uncharacterized protein YcbX